QRETLSDCVEYFTQIAQITGATAKITQRMHVKLKDHPTVRKIVAAPKYWIRGTTMHSSLQKRIDVTKEMNCRLGVVEAVFEYGAQFYQTLTSDEPDTRRSISECYQLCQQGAQIVKRQKIVQRESLATLQKAFDLVYPHPEMSRWLPF
ncbi:MAG: hypothetical protein Q7K45_07510, partial [Nanoarchaeota archaeon]|nr:hypothetical protein [Nanoarchaeota archaeon]